MTISAIDPSRPSHFDFMDTNPIPNQAKAVRDNFSLASADINSLWGVLEAPTWDFGTKLVLGGKYGGTATDYSTFEADGTYKAVGAATTWTDINISGLSLAGGPAAPTAVNVNGSTILAYSFSGTNPTPDELHGSLEILHDYKEGSDIVPHVHWAPSTADVGDVKWQLEYMWINSGANFSGSTVISGTTAAGGVAWNERRTNLGTISGAGKTIGSRFAFRLFRDAADAADTYDAGAVLFDIGVHYERDTLGSRQITTK